MMKASGKQQLFAIVTLFSIILPQNSAEDCPTSLPQHVPPHHSCYTSRYDSLKKRRSIFGLKPPSPMLQYSRLNMSIPEYTEFLKTEPFLGLHAKLLSGNFYANNVSFHKYLKATAKLPRIPQLTEYEAMSEALGKVPTQLFGEYMRKPSNFEPFQNDASSWITDELFAEQRVAGNNPMGLRQVTFSDKRGINWDSLNKTLNPNFDWEDAFRQCYGSCSSGKKKDEDSIKKAIKKGHIFVLRHRLCDDVPLKDDLAKPTGQHHRRDMWALLSPIVLFASVPSHDKKDPKNNRRLKPFAIQMNYKPDSTVYSPRDNCGWMLAKLNVQLTDIIHAQLVEHLSKVHFTAEVLCVSIERHLSKYHPLHVIMKYHCRGITTSNTLGAPALVMPHGSVHQLFPVGYEGALLLINRASQVTDWRDMDLETDLKKRGVENEKQLPYYPYRDDGRVLVAAIKSMVTDYVNAYYRTDYDVVADYELRAYVNEVSKDGQGGIGNFRGFPARVDNKKGLIEIFSRMIWLFTGQHASVNFPLSDYALYPPNVPTKLYNDSRGPDMEFSIYNLPYRVTSAMQNRVFLSLGLLRLDRLFDYGSFLTDARGREVLYKHHYELVHNVEPILDERNKRRYEGGHLTYPYFLPRWLPNGVQT